MSLCGQGTKWRRNIAENLNRLSRVHERYRPQTTDGRRTTYSEREHEFTLAKNDEAPGDRTPQAQVEARRWERRGATIEAPRCGGVWGRGVPLPTGEGAVPHSAEKFSNF